MKTLLLCACILACMSFSAAHHKKAELRKALLYNPEDDITACLNEVGLTSDTMLNEEDIVNGAHLQPDMQDRRTKTGCLMECCMKKDNLMDESGFKEDEIRNSITTELNATSFEAVAQGMAHECLQEAKDMPGHCEKGFKLWECIVKAVHDLADDDE